MAIIPKVNHPFYTVALIKSRALKRANGINIIAKIVESGFDIVRMRTKPLCPTEIEAFYKEHVGRPYYDSLVESVSGGIIAMILEIRDPTLDPIKAWREAIGATDASKAAEGTFRNLFGGYRFYPNAPLSDNAVHGSGSWTKARFEASLLFGMPNVK